MFHRIVMSIVVICSVAGAAPGGEAFLAQDGRPRADIVIADHPPRMVKLAAAELQQYVLKISGAKLPIATRPDPAYTVHVYVGRSPHTDRLGITDEGLKHGALRVVSDDTWLVLLGHDADFTPPPSCPRDRADRLRAEKEWDTLTGGRWGHPMPSVFKAYNSKLGIWEYDQRGSLNAVHEFLRSLGVRWYMPGELGQVVPKIATLALPKIDKTIRPDFAVRGLSFYSNAFFQATPDEVMWQLRLGLSSGREVIGLAGGGHGIYHVHCRDATKRDHPEYYALLGGKRDTETRGSGRPCLSSEGLWRSNVEYARAVFDIYGEPMVSVMPPDGYVDLCQCDLCRGKGTPQRGYEGRLSDYVWDYVQRVAKELYKTHPDRKVICYAYGAYLLPPEKIDKLSPNVVVGICQWRSDFRNPETRKKFAKLRQAWLDKAPSRELTVWDYYLHGRPGRALEGLPAYFPRQIADDLRSLKGISLGDFIEVYRHPPDKAPTDLAVNHLNCYMTSRFLWDSQQDIGAMLDEYYGDFYGPAAGPMKAFVEFCEANWSLMPKDTKPINKALELLAAARQAAGHSIHGQRIDLVAQYVKPLEQLRDRLAKGRDPKLPGARALHCGKSTIKIDGRLDEPFWDRVPAYRLRDLVTGKPPANATSFRLAWAEDALIFGVRCDDSDMKNLNIGGKDRDDSAVWLGDAVELLIETQTHSYYQLAVSPAGALVDVDRAQGINTLWSSAADVAAYRGDTFWSFEIRIPVAGENATDIDPLNGVAGRRPSENYPWHINVCRQRIRDKQRELSAFSPTGKTVFHDVPKFGTLIAR